MKRYLFIFNLLLGLTVYASDFTVGSLNYDIVSAKDKIAKPVELNSNVETLDIPFEVEYDGVIFTIPTLDYITNSKLLAGYTASVKNIVLHEGVVTINSAFKNFSSLESIVIPSSVRTLGAAFQSCSSLKSIIIPNSVENITGALFEGCSSLTDVNFEGNPRFVNTQVTLSATSSVFQNCTSLESINLPQSLTYIGSNFFKGCTNLKQVSVSDKCISIGDSCFENCSSLTEFKFPDSLESIGRYSFASSALSGTINLPDKVRFVGERAFQSCKGIEQFIFSDNCSLMVEAGALCECSNLKVITIPNNGGTFKGLLTDSPVLEKIVSLNYFPPTIESDFLNQSSLLKAHLEIRGNAHKNYAESSTWGNFLHIDDLYENLGTHKINFNFEIPDEYRTLYDIYYPEQSISVMDGNSALINVSYTRAGYTSSHGDFIPYYNDIEIPSSATIPASNFVQNLNMNNDNYAQRFFMTPPVHADSEFSIRYANSSIKNIAYDDIDFHREFEVYNLSGIKLDIPLDTLPKGIYIILQGNKTRKIAVK